jgi:hypothetical protein
LKVWHGDPARQFYRRDAEDAEKSEGLEPAPLGVTTGAINEILRSEPASRSFQVRSFSLILLSALGVSAVNYKPKRNARNAEPSVPRMGVAASDG